MKIFIIDFLNEYTKIILILILLIVPKSSFSLSTPVSSPYFDYDPNATGSENFFKYVDINTKVYRGGVYITGAIPQFINKYTNSCNYDDYGYIDYSYPHFIKNSPYITPSTLVPSNVVFSNFWYTHGYSYYVSSYDSPRKYRNLYEGPTKSMDYDYFVVPYIWPKAYVTRNVDYTISGTKLLRYPVADFYVPEKVDDTNALSLQKIDEVMSNAKSTISTYLGPTIAESTVIKLKDKINNDTNSFLNKRIDEYLQKQGSDFGTASQYLSNSYLTFDRGTVLFESEWLLNNPTTKELFTSTIPENTDLIKFDAGIDGNPRLWIRVALMPSTSLDLSFIKTGIQEYEALGKVKLVGWAGLYIEKTEIKASVLASNLILAPVVLTLLPTLAVPLAPLAFGEFKASETVGFEGYMLMPFEYNLSVGYKIKYDIDVPNNKLIIIYEPVVYYNSDHNNSQINVTKFKPVSYLDIFDETSNFLNPDGIDDGVLDSYEPIVLNALKTQFADTYLKETLDETFAPFLKSCGENGEKKEYSLGTVMGTLVTQLPYNDINFYYKEFVNGQYDTYYAPVSITTGPKFTINTGAEISFVAGKSIILEAGFTANVGSKFNAFIR